MTCDRCSGVGRELSERRGRTLLSFSRPCLPPSLLCATPSLGDFTVLFPWTWPWPSRVYLRPRGPKTSVSRCVSAKGREPVPFRSSNPDFRFCVESGGRTSITVPQLRRLPCEMESAGAGGAAPPPPGSSAVLSRKDGLSSGSGTQTCGGSRTSGCGQVPVALPSPPQSFAVRTHRGRRGSRAWSVRCRDDSCFLSPARFGG